MSKSVLAFARQFVFMPARQMQRQRQMQHSMMASGGIDRTRLAIADSASQQRSGAFSFAVMGDTDAGEINNSESFATAFAQQMMAQTKESRFFLHIGDITYPLGTYQNYLSGFLRPYQALLSSVPEKADYASQNKFDANRGSSVVFSRPVLSVPGNHDYARLPFWPTCYRKVTRFFCDRLRQSIGLDLGHYGGEGGEAYDQTFLDDLSHFSPTQLKQHLLEHYSVPIDNHGIKSLDTSELAYCLNYVPGQFTRLPNRYYTFHYGGIDFFALDSNTWKSDPREPNFDQAQLDWLEQGLVQSWRSPDSVGRIIYLHHSPYTTETTRWQHPETLWVRRHLRNVLDSVKATIALDAGEYSANDSPLVDLIVSGHAHCLEHLKTGQTGHADAELNWLVCGGSGVDIRRQRRTGTDILETISIDEREVTKVVAKSHLYAGAHGQGSKKQRFHSFVQIDVHPNSKQGLVIRPFVVAKGRNGWQTKALKEISVGSSFLGHSRYFRNCYSKDSVEHRPSVVRITKQL